MVVSASRTSNIAGSWSGGGGAVAGIAAANAAAASRLTIHHPPVADGAVERSAEAMGATYPWREKSRIPSTSRIRPPSPIPRKDGHRLFKKCLAKSAKRELFPADGSLRAANGGSLDAPHAVAVPLQHRDYRV